MNKTRYYPWRIITPLLLTMAACASGNGIVYVDADAAGQNDGSSWQDAYSFLQDALAVSGSQGRPLEIRVAAGTYTPDKGGAKTPGDRTATFQLVNGVTLKGGYAGYGTLDPDQRDVAAFEAVLNGDLQNDDLDVSVTDLPTEPSRADNSLHVVTASGCDQTAVLDGFTITAGNDNRREGVFAIGKGAALFNDSGSPTLVKCTFRRNSAGAGRMAFGGEGGAMYNASAVPTLIDCTFADNTASEKGGAIENVDSNPRFAGCTFIDNGAESPSASGGAIDNLTSSPALTDCVFEGNRAGAGGGAIANDQYSAPVLKRCTFTANLAGVDGGGIGGGGGLITDCTFTRNAARQGGGISGAPTVIRCTFTANSAGMWGGGMYSPKGVPALIDCTFERNDAPQGGGIHGHVSLSNCTFRANIASDGAALDGGGAIQNCVFVANSAARTGGAIHTGKSVLENCIFVGNGGRGTAWNTSGRGGAISAEYGHVTVTNCTFAANSAPRGSALALEATTLRITGSILRDTCEEIWQSNDSVIAITHSNIRNGWPGQGNIDCDPQFVRNAAGGPDGWADDPATPAVDEGSNDDAGDLHLAPASPCIDAGDNEADTDASTPTRLRMVGVDRDARIRFADDPNTTDTGKGAPPIVDMGAYEFASVRIPEVVFVDAGAAGRGSGANWSDAFDDLTMALRTSAAAGGAIRELRVAAGRYVPDPNGLDDPRKAVFQLVNDVALYGGFPPGGGEWPDRAPNTFVTVLSGDLNDNDVAVEDLSTMHFDMTRTENSYHVVIGSKTGPTAMLDGFTITGGFADKWSGGDFGDSGGGILNCQGNPTVSDCRFVVNYAALHGGGMFNWMTSRPVVSSCTFEKNTAWNAAGGGGGIHNGFYSSPTVTDCEFTGNTGGGMYNYVYSNPVVQNCFFKENSASFGGAIHNHESSPLLADCLFMTNSGSSGGGVYNGTSNSCPKFARCLFMGNTAHSGGGIYTHGLPAFPQAPVLINCAFLGNSAFFNGGGMYIDGGGPTLINCLFSRNSALHGVGGAMYAAAGTITNCTFSSNSASLYGGITPASADLSVTNCVLWGNTDTEGFGESAQIKYYTSTPSVNYSCIQGWTGALGGLGNIDKDPLFADPANDDCHLKSQAGRWDPRAQAWLLDDVTSPCIDAGNPAMPVGDEPLPNGNRINMGAYGGTAEASKTPDDWSLLADMTNNGAVGWDDLAILAAHWLSSETGGTGDLDRDGLVGSVDLALLAESWLLETSWHQP